jgi:hypothetical protein
MISPKTESPKPPEWWIEAAFRPGGLTAEERKQLNIVQLCQYLEERDTYWLLQAFEGVPKHPPKPPYKPAISDPEEAIDRHSFAALERLLKKKQPPTIDSPPLAP